MFQLMIFSSSFTLQCTSCHNPHVITGKYWEAESGKSPITRPDFSDSINNPRAMGKTLWGAVAGEKMDDYAAIGTGSGGWYFSKARGGNIIFDQPGKYQPPKAGSGYSFEYSGKVLPDYTSFCLDCHQNNMGGNTQGAVNWSGDNYKHGLTAANNPAAMNYGSTWYGSRGNPDPIFSVAGVQVGRGAKHFMRWPYETSDRISGVNFVMSCTDCHEAHGSDRGGFIRERFNVNANGDCGTGGNSDPDGENCRDGGNWNGFCNACHYYYGGGHAGMSCGNASCHLKNSIHRIDRKGSSGSTRLQLTASGQQGNYVAPDFTPDIVSADGTVGSNELTVTFITGVYTNMDLSGVLIPEDFWIFDKNGDNPKTIISVSHNAGDDTATLTLSAPLIMEDILYDTVAVRKGSIWNWYDGGYNNWATGIIGAQAVSAGPYPYTISLSSACPPGNIFFPLNEGAGALYTFDDQFSIFGTVGAPVTAFTGDGYFHGDPAQSTYIDFTNSAGCLLNIAGTGYQQKVTIEALFKTNDVDLDYDGPGDQFPAIDSTFNRIIQRHRTFLVTVMRADYTVDNVDARAGKARIEVKYRVPAAYRRTCTQDDECGGPGTAPCDGAWMKQVSTDIDTYPIVSNHWYRMRVVFNSTKTRVPIDIWVDDKGTDGNDAGELWAGYINIAKPDPVDSGGCKWMAQPGDEMESENQLTYIGSPPNHNNTHLFDGLIDWVLWKPDADYAGVDDGPHY